MLWGSNTVYKANPGITSVSLVIIPQGVELSKFRTKFYIQWQKKKRQKYTNYITSS